jgi:hypothetical protein
MSHGNALLRGNAALTFWPGPRPVGETHLERARRIAFYLTRRHRRGTPEYRYRLGLEYDIWREVRRGQRPQGASEL